ncbi:hypothetical protein GY24_12330 [Microterricola pindariensis]|uniref:Secreted protein n=1 Tax=Microterricola pindariensis TaxID=478010 RepID=A0ABX5AUH9_9MICO|nr:hypothetical protein GY24_12330 [Microterricola pindariensis]
MLAAGCCAWPLAAGRWLLRMAAGCCVWRVSSAWSARLSAIGSHSSARTRRLSERGLSTSAEGARPLHVG